MPSTDSLLFMRSPVLLPVEHESGIFLFKSSIVSILLFLFLKSALAQAPYSTDASMGDFPSWLQRFMGCLCSGAPFGCYALVFYHLIKDFMPNKTFIWHFIYKEPMVLCPMATWGCWYWVFLQTELLGSWRIFWRNIHQKKY